MSRTFLARAASLAVCCLPLAPSASGQLPGADANPFGIASGAEWSGEYPRFEPLLGQAGVKWLRYFPEWHSLQPAQGKWDWKRADEFVATSNANGIQLTAPLAYFAPWASFGNDTRTFPVKDMQYWRDFVAGVVGRYGKDIQYWEAWNEPQAFQKNGTPEMYAEMVREAYKSAKKANPDAKIGLTSANFAVAYLDMVLAAGAKDHFDYLCVHPYENMEQLTRPGGEVYFLSMAGSLRRLLKAHGQREDIPLWITEIGWQSTIEPNETKDALQARQFTKAYVLLLAQGFERVFWFEARGPAYGKGTDHGLLRSDWSPRPAYTALKAMTAALGAAPKYAGWLDWNGAYGFVFESGGKAVVAAWAPVDAEAKVEVGESTSIRDLTGEVSALAGKTLVLTNSPVFIANPPSAWVSQAKANRAKPFPWGGDFSGAAEVAWNAAGGKPAGLEAIGDLKYEGEGADRALRIEKGKGLSLRANPTFAPYGTKELEFQIVARRAPGGKQAGFQLMYETLKTIHGYERAGWWTVPAEEGWQEYTWRVTDANFVGTWGYNLSLAEVNGPLLVKEIRVRKAGPER